MWVGVKVKRCCLSLIKLNRFSLLGRDSGELYILLWDVGPKQEAAVGHSPEPITALTEQAGRCVLVLPRGPAVVFHLRADVSAVRSEADIPLLSAFQV